MTRSVERFEYLYRQYATRTCTEAELEEFLTYVNDPGHRETLAAMMDRHLDSLEVPAGLPVVDWDHLYQQIIPSPVVKPARRKGLVLAMRLAAAACILLACVGVWWAARQRKAAPAAPPLAEKVVAPGYNKATLTLGDGTTLTLDSAHTGELAKQGDAAVVNTGNGSLAYEAASGAAKKVLYNTVTTPRGGQYQVVLPDGSKVWLNAASSITYPTAFTGPDRVIEMTGEAYFEVVHNAAKPFRVKAGRYTVEDIGTSFNVNGYTDEPALVTTLLQGAVRIGGHTLTPGQQASADADGAVLVSKGDPVQAVAWKNGFFDFSDASLQTVMRQLSRWYNVQVEYEGNIRQRQFNGMIGRTLTLGQVLRGLSREGVHYRIEANNHLIITP